MEGWLPDRFLVALPLVRDLLLCAKHLFVQWHALPGVEDEQWELFSPEF